MDHFILLDAMEVCLTCSRLVHACTQWQILSPWRQMSGAVYMPRMSWACHLLHSLWHPASCTPQLCEPSVTEQAEHTSSSLSGQLESCAGLQWTMKEGNKEENHRNCGRSLFFLPRNLYQCRRLPEQLWSTLRYKALEVHMETAEVTVSLNQKQINKET